MDCVLATTILYLCAECYLMSFYLFILLGFFLLLSVRSCAVLCVCCLYVCLFEMCVLVFGFWIGCSVGGPTVCMCRFTIQAPKCAKPNKMDLISTFVTNSNELCMPYTLIPPNAQDWKSLFFSLHWAKGKWKRNISKMMRWLWETNEMLWHIDFHFHFSSLELLSRQKDVITIYLNCREIFHRNDTWPEKNLHLHKVEK